MYRVIFFSVIWEHSRTLAITLHWADPWSKTMPAFGLNARLIINPSVPNERYIISYQLITAPFFIFTIFCIFRIRSVFSIRVSSYLRPHPNICLIHQSCWYLPTTKSRAKFPVSVAVRIHNCDAGRPWNSNERPRCGVITKLQYRYHSGRCGRFTHKLNFSTYFGFWGNDFRNTYVRILYITP